MEPLPLDVLRRLDAAHLLHPFTDQDDVRRAGTRVIRSARGCTVIDESGRELIDAIAGLWCVNVGYGRREIADAVHRQLSELAFYPSFFKTTTEPAIVLAAKLAEIAPGRLTQVFFSNSGSEANETALKLIRAYFHLTGQSRKSKIVSREFGYHGVTLATTSMTGLAACTEPFNLPLPGFVKVPAPYPYAAGDPRSAEDYGEYCLAETARVFEREDPLTIAALFAEPIQGAGGVIVPPPGYLRGLRDLCRSHDVLFVADEVITGFGRLGAWFASELWDLDPDLLTLAKGVTSGYLPLGATLVSSEIADVLAHGGTLSHGFTYSAHPTTCAAGVANLAIIERERLIPRVRDDVGPYFQSGLARFAGHRAVGEVRGMQLVGALDLLPRGGRAAIDPKRPLGLVAADRVREEGAIVRGMRDAIALAPPLVVTRDEIDRIFATVERGLDRLWD